MLPHQWTIHIPKIIFSAFVNRSLSFSKETRGFDSAAEGSEMLACNFVQ
jgi:hypothetical protein